MSRLRESRGVAESGEGTRLASGGVLVVVVLGLLSMAPTSGDVGGCGSEPTLLDVGDFAEARKDEDCDRCQECAISSARCQRACEPETPPDTVIPATCRPLRRDGEVCLRALRAASCSKFATYVADVAPKTPSECEFCRSGSAPSGSLGGATPAETP